MNHQLHGALDGGPGSGEDDSKLNALANDVAEMRMRIENIDKNCFSFFDNTNNGFGGFGTGMIEAGGSFRLTNGVYNGSKFSLYHYSSGWGGGSVARIKTYNMKFYGGILSKLSYIGTGLLGAYNMGSGYIKDGNSFGENFKLATVQTLGGATGAAIGAKTFAVMFSYLGPYGIVGGGIVGGIIGGIGGTKLSEYLYLSTK